MYLSTENKKKLIIASMVIAFSSMSQLAGKTLANTLIVTSYATGILPYFYFALAILMIIATTISSIYQHKNPQKFAYIVKFGFLVALLFFTAALQWGGALVPFAISILLLTCTSIVSLLAWNYVSDIFDIQEFKRFSKILQSSATLGAIFSGALVAIISTTFNPSKLLGLIFCFEVLSLFFISPLLGYLPLPKVTNKTQLKLSSTIRKNSMFKYLALMSIASIVTSTLIDYNLKLELVAELDKQKIAHAINIIFVISTTGILLVQFFLLDRLLHIFGSKKIIIIYPLVILITALIALFRFNFISMALLFIINEIFGNTTLSLSRNLYLNILPQAIRSLERMKLGGTIIPLGVILASGIVLGITYTNFKASLSLVLITVCTVLSLYLAKILIKKYRQQLTQSLYLRRFNNDLINMNQVEDQDIEYLLKQALNYPAPEAILFGLQLLANNKSLRLPSSLGSLVTGENPIVVKEVARILADRKSQRQFVNDALLALAQSNEEETQWYLTLYLIDSHSDALLSQVPDLLKRKTSASLAIVCLIYLKEGDLDQQLTAMHSLQNMFHSQDIEKKKWFLYILNEIPMVHKEKYLTQFIDQDNPSLQILALQQVGTHPCTHLMDSLISHLGESRISPALNACLIEIGEKVIERLIDKLMSTSTYPIKMSCIRTLSLLSGKKSELSLMNVLSNSHDVVMKTAIAKYIAYRGVKCKVSAALNDFLIDMIKKEVDLFFYLTAQIDHYKSELIQDEIKSRLQFIKMRVLYYTTAVIGSLDILNSVSLLTSFHPDKNQQAIALELIDTTSENREISSLLMALFIDSQLKDYGISQPMDDPWLNQFIQDIESNTMDSIYTLTKLRKINLFKDLAAETLQVLAECCYSRDMASGEIIFSEGDSGDGIYIIDSGEVTVTKKGIAIANLTEGAYFGELALLADIPRFATVTSSSEGVLFYIDKQDFDRITDEIPEIMKSINKQVIKYLTTNADVLSGNEL